MNDVMGMPLWAWVLFYVAVLIMLVIDLRMFGRKGQHEVNMREALAMTGVWIAVSLLFCLGIYLFYPEQGAEKATEFLAGYVIEKSLSMDNLFVRHDIRSAVSGIVHNKCATLHLLANQCCHVRIAETR